MLSVYFEIFCYKICLEVEKMAKKMWKICRKHFQNVTKHRKSFFKLFFIVEPNIWISFSLQEFIFLCIHFTLEIWFT